MKESPRTMTTFVLFLMYLPLLKQNSKNEETARPKTLPTAMPQTMETGMLAKLTAFMFPPCARDVKVVKRTMTKTSSRDAPASISWGMPFFVPYPSSISFTILGTTTAGDTAARTEPISAASTRVMPKIDGAMAVYAATSKQAGRKDIRSAGRPIFLRSAMSRERPAFISMIIRAI